MEQIYHVTQIKLAKGWPVCGLSRLNVFVSHNELDPDYKVVKMALQKQRQLSVGWQPY